MGGKGISKGSVNGGKRDIKRGCKWGKRYQKGV